MSIDPKVIEPADYNMKKSAKKCGMHMGIFGCPICDQNFNDYGGMHVVECVKCNFQFPTDWWPVYSSGVNDGRRIAAGGAELSGGMKIRMENPYYRTGFECPEGEAWKTRRQHDWRTITAEWKPSICKTNRMCNGICERCGKPKDESRKNRSGECIQCEAETECKHRCSMMEKCCKAGVNFKELGDGKLGIGKSMPCYYVAGTIPIHCPKFELKTVDEIKEEDREMDLSMARFMLVGPLVRKIKETHKGKSWSGVEECPACKGKLHLSHAAYNGHVHGNCETEGCLSWME